MYTCKVTFTATNGTLYQGKQNIPGFEYEQLSTDDQENFFHNMNGSDKVKEEED